MPSKASKKRRMKWLRKVENAQTGNQAQVWSEGRSDDIVVVVMGPTGVGKSTFIKHLIHGRVDEAVTHSVEVGEDLDSCTLYIQPIPILKDSIPFSLQGLGNRLVIVDTPGFDDTYTDDSEVLKRIAEWLATSYSKDMKLGGAIYLHDISQPRVNNTTRRNFDTFQALCGDSAANAVVLGTTKWASVAVDAAREREKQLCENFWGTLMLFGARTARFENTSASAWAIVEDLLNPNIDARLIRIHNELEKIIVELEKIIPATEAGHKLRYSIREVRDMHRKSASRSTNRDHRDKMKEKMQLIENLVAQIDQPMWYRLKTFFLGKDNI